MLNTKYKYLLKNIGLLTVTNFGSKILSFLLIPLYTSVLSTAEYGTYDMYYTTVSLMIPILTFNIVEAVMRFTLEKEKNSSKVFSVGFVRVMQSAGIFTIATILNKLFNIIPLFSDFWIFLILLYIGTLFYDLLSQFCRGVERVGTMAIAGAIQSISMLLLNILFLLFLRRGLQGYFIANTISYFLGIIFLGIRLHIWNYIDYRLDTKLKAEMYSYSKPLVFNTIAWWINNASDRYIVTLICGVAANGIYSVAYKIPSILNIFQSIFSQAWVLSAIKEYDKGDSPFYSNIYKIYNASMVLVCSVLITGDRFIARVLYANEFFEAWKYAPFLMISVVFGSLSGLLGGIFSAAKDSKVFARTTIVGASVNTILNIILVYLWGPVGAAVATLISYCLVWLARLREANIIIQLEILLRRDMISYCILLIQGLIWILDCDFAFKYCLEFTALIVVVILYWKDLEYLIVGFRKRILKGNK